MAILKECSTICGKTSTEFSDLFCIFDRFDLVLNHQLQSPFINVTLLKIMKQQDGKGGNLSSLDLVEGENNYDQFFEFWLPGKI